MKNFEAYTLFSSSKGNSAYIKAGDTEILIDTGKSCKAICTALNSIGTELDRIDAVFITHAHSDHTMGLATLSKKGKMPIYATGKTANQIMDKCGPDRISPMEDRFSVMVGDVTVRSFVTPHDSMGSVGYIVDFGGEYCFGYCTDTGCISREMAEELAHCDGVLIEANYDEKMLNQGCYPDYLKARISSPTGHQSNSKAAQLCCILARAGVKKIMLGHISPENNLPELALKCCCNALFENGFDDVEITVADRYLPTRF